jgi:hypothetical protein
MEGHRLLWGWVNYAFRSGRKIQRGSGREALGYGVNDRMWGGPEARRGGLWIPLWDSLQVDAPRLAHHHIRGPKFGVRSGGPQPCNIRAWHGDLEEFAVVGARGCDVRHPLLASVQWNELIPAW